MTFVNASLTNSVDRRAVKHWVVLVFAALWCTSAPPKPDAATIEAPGPTVIATDKGSVEGAKLDASRAFLGIPYAAPPVGSMRWKPPADAQPWTGTKSAMAYGHECPQLDLTSGKPVADLVEDCLFLNVWTPLASPAKPALPSPATVVMIPVGTATRRTRWLPQSTM